MLLLGEHVIICLMSEGVGLHLHHQEAQMTNPKAQVSSLRETGRGWLLTEIFPAWSHMSFVNFLVIFSSVPCELSGISSVFAASAMVAGLTLFSETHFFWKDRF